MEKLPALPPPSVHTFKSGIWSPISRIIRARSGTPTSITVTPSNYTRACDWVTGNMFFLITNGHKGMNDGTKTTIKLTLPIPARRPFKCMEDVEVYITTFCSPGNNVKKVVDSGAIIGETDTFFISYELETDLEAFVVVGAHLCYHL